jgi:MFS family permease
VSLNLIAVGFTLGLAASVLYLGAVADRYGRRRMLLGGLALAFGGTVSSGAVIWGALSGVSDLLFRRNSLDGCLEVVVRTGTWGGLNSILHAN